MFMVYLKGQYLKRKWSTCFRIAKTKLNLTNPMLQYWNQLRPKFTRIIETKRNKKSVIRLPLQYVRNLMKSAQVFFIEPYSEKMLIRLMMEPVELAL